MALLPSTTTVVAKLIYNKLALLFTNKQPQHKRKLLSTANTCMTIVSVFFGTRKEKKNFLQIS